MLYFYCCYQQITNDRELKKMNKELARYFVKLIAEDLQFSFNGMGIPSYSCEWLENQLIQGNFEDVKEFIQKRYDEHENSAKDTNVRGKKTQA